MIKTLFFDLDQTLFDFHKAEAEALRKTLTAFGVTPVPAIVQRYSEINQSQWELLELGKLTRDQVLVRRFDLLLEELQLDVAQTGDVGAQMAKIYEGHLMQGHYFMEGAEELLECLYPNYDMYLMSNGTAHVQDSRLKSANISHFFKEIFISQRIGYNKPDVRFFEACFLRIADFHREESIIIGDSLTSDIQGGINAGIRTCWFHVPGTEPSPGLLPDYEITSLAMLPGLLEKL